MQLQESVARRETTVEESPFAQDVVAGLSARPKRLSPKYFYDEEGSRLFEQITALPEYYPTRCELAILEAHAAEMGRLLPAHTALVEFGSGSTRKVRILLAASPTVEAYVPVDISAEMLAREAAQLQEDRPHLKVFPVAADFTLPFRLPKAIAGFAHAGFFPGSTIGNFEPHQASAFLQHAGRVLGHDAVLIIGVDLVKDPAILNAAYEDAQGVTAKFNLNLLARINRELGADFDLDGFSHQAFYNSERRRVEMHLASRRRQSVRLLGRTIGFRAGETIHTENSYKYTPETFAGLAARAGWRKAGVFTDPEWLFAVFALRAAG